MTFAQKSIDRIRWAVEFAQLDLPALRAGDRLNLQEDLSEFLVGDQIGEVPESVLRELQLEVCRLFDAVILSKSSSTECFRIESHCYFQAVGDELVVRSTGALRDRVLTLLVAALVTEPSDRVRRCLECGRLFVRVRRQTHCSRRCINRWTSRLYYRKKLRARKGLGVHSQPFGTTLAQKSRHDDDLRDPGSEPCGP